MTQIGFDGCAEGSNEGETDVVGLAEIVGVLDVVGRMEIVGFELG